MEGVMFDRNRPYEPLTSDNAALILVDHQVGLMTGVRDLSPAELDYATLMMEIMKDNTRPEAGAVYGAIDMDWARLVGQLAQAYGK
jgi:hypothetical protein